MPLLSKPNNINIVWASGGDRVAPDAAKIATGWLAEIPPRQYFNYIDWKQDQWVAYSNQLGIPEWDNQTEYQANKSVVQGSNGIIYQCLITHTNSDPISDVSNRWKRIAIDEAPSNGQQYVRRNNAWQQIDSTAFAPAVHTHPISQVVGLENALNNKLNISGTVPTLNSTGNIELRLASPSGTTNILRGAVGGVNHWYIGKGGSENDNLTIQSYIHGTSLTLLSDRITSNKDLYVGSNGVWHEGNFNPGSYLPLTGGSVSGGVILTGTTNATSAYTGVLQVRGGIGVVGNVFSGGNVVGYSDIKLKTDIERIDNALDKISKVSGYTYTKKDTGNRETGVIAQEIQEILPEAVFGEETLAVAYGNLVGLLIEGIKELKEELDALKQKVLKED